MAKRRYVVSYGPYAAVVNTTADTARGMLAKARQALKETECATAHPEVFRGNLADFEGRVIVRTYRTTYLLDNYNLIFFDLENNTFHAVGFPDTPIIETLEDLVTATSKPGLYKIVGARSTTWGRRNRGDLVWCDGTSATADNWARHLTYLNPLGGDYDLVYLEYLGLEWACLPRNDRWYPKALTRTVRTSIDGTPYLELDEYVEAHYFTSELDGELYRNYNKTYVHDADGVIHVWERHQIQQNGWACDCCHGSYTNDVGRVEVLGMTVCPDCAARATTCDACGQLTVRPYRRGMHTYCSDCEKYHRDLTCYHHTNGTNFMSRNEIDETLGLYLGVELETEDGREGQREDWAAEVRDTMETLTGDRSNCETKRDSSLGNNGVEIVTQPATPMWHLTSGFWESVMRKAAQRGVASETTTCCGLHVHVNRNFFGDRDAAKAGMTTMKRLTERFYDEFKRFSRRQSFRWCRMENDGSLGIFSDDSPHRKRHESWSKRNCDHYHAFNFENSATVELRFFRGTLQWSDFSAVIEMVAALALVSKTLGNDGGLIESWTWTDFKDEASAALDLAGIPSGELETYLKEMNL